MSAHLPLLVAQVATEAGRVGRIQGGWGYVWSAYGIAWGGMALYGLTLWLRHKRQAASKEQP